LEHGNPPHPRVFPITVFANDEARAIVGLRDIAVQNIDELVRDQIRAHIGSKFKGHALARLIAAVLEAEGYVTSVSSPGKYGGVKFLAGLGSLGLDAPRLCVQMKLGSETERRYRARRPPRHDAETSKPITGCSSVGAG
jgi:hypothetical protein